MIDIFQARSVALECGAILAAENVQHLGVKKIDVSHYSEPFLEYLVNGDMRLFDARCVALRQATRISQAKVDNEKTNADVKKTLQMSRAFEKWLNLGEPANADIVGVLPKP